MIKLADIVAYSPDDKLQLIVEVKNKKGATADWAAEMRRNLVAHSVLPNAPFFLLALPEHFYLWKQAGHSGSVIHPDYEVDAKPILEAYTDNLKFPIDKMSEYGLELMVTSWLNSLMNTSLTKETAKPHERWLLESGLYDAIKNGSVKTEAAA